MRATIAVLVTLGIVLTGCGGGGGGHDSAESGVQQTSLRVVHNSPDAPNIDVAVNGSTVLRGVPYGAFSPYLNLEAGTTSI